MYLKIPSKKKLLNEKDSFKKDKKSNPQDKYYKQQNLDISTINADKVLELQNKIGNKQSIVLLRELADLKINDEGLLDNYHGDNENLEMHREIQNFKKLSKNNGLDSEDAVKSGRFSVDHNNVIKPSIESQELPNALTGLIQMVNFLKGYDSRRDDKNEEVKSLDKLNSFIDNKKIMEVDMIIKMIKGLPYFSGDEETIEKYMKVQKFLISSHVDLENFFRNNGNLPKQKELILEAVNNK